MTAPDRVACSALLVGFNNNDDPAASTGYNEEDGVASRVEKWSRRLSTLFLNAVVHVHINGQLFIVSDHTPNLFLACFCHSGIVFFL